MLHDEIQFPAAADNAREPGGKLLIYFLPANVGFIEYYRNFFVDLRNSLKDVGREDVTIYAAGYPGFEMHKSTITQRQPAHRPPYTLDEVAKATQLNLSRKARELSGDSKSAEPVRVILIGHSVGSYLLLETIRWWQEQKSEQEVFSIVGGIGLFPIFLEVAKSQNAEPLRWFLKVSPFMFPAVAYTTAMIMQFIARLVSLIPPSLWDWPRGMTAGDKRPDHVAAAQAVMRTRNGPRQAIYLAAYEMIDVKEDKWSPTNIWGVNPKQDSGAAALGARAGVDFPRTKLLFYWGKNDGWIDNETRDKFIAKRAKRVGDDETQHWPEMVIDAHDIDHSFTMTTEHSQIVAKRLAAWIGNLV